jgi:plastocyanin
MRKLKSVILALASLAGPANAAETTAEIATFQFMPSEISVTSGSTVTWTNRDGIEHSVTADAMTDGKPAFDSGLFRKGESRSLTFSEPGTFAFHCARHSSMTGTITVK